MNGSWHRYRPGERWRRPPGRARFVHRGPGARSPSASMPRSSSSSSGAPRPSTRRSAGSDRTCSAPDLDADEAIRRLRDPFARRAPPSPRRSSTSVRSPASPTSGRTRPSGRQSAPPRHSPPVGALDDETLVRLVATARRLLVAIRGKGGGGGGVPPRAPAGIGFAPRLRSHRPAVSALRDIDHKTPSQGTEIHRGRPTGARPASRHPPRHRPPAP